MQTVDSYDLVGVEPDHRRAADRADDAHRGEYAVAAGATEGEDACAPRGVPLIVMLEGREHSAGTRERERRQHQRLPALLVEAA